MDTNDQLLGEKNEMETILHTSHPSYFGGMEDLNEQKGKYTLKDKP